MGLRRAGVREDRSEIADAADTRFSVDPLHNSGKYPAMADLIEILNPIVKHELNSVIPLHTRSQLQSKLFTNFLTGTQRPGVHISD